MPKKFHEPPLEFSRTIIEGVEIKRCRNTEHAFKPHIHDELFLGFILEGETHLSFNDETIHFKQGDGVIIPPLTTHRCAPEDINQWAYSMLYVDTSFYKEHVSFSQSKKLCSEQTLRLKLFIEALLEEENLEMLKTILVEMLLEFGDEVEEKDSPYITQVHRYILNHWSKDISLEKLEKNLVTASSPLLDSSKRSMLLLQQLFIYKTEWPKPKHF